MISMTQSSKKCISWVLPFVIFILSAISVYSSSVYSAKKEKLVIYSGRSASYIKPAIEAFTKATKIRVKVHHATSASLLTRLKREKAATRADIYIASDVSNLYRGNQLGLFAPVTNKIASVIPLQFRGQNNNWLGLAARLRVLVVNTKSKKIDFVQSIFDLADPRLKGKIAIRSRHKERNIAGISSYVLSTDEAKVKKWLKGIKSNSKGQVYFKQSKIIDRVAKGRKLVGLVDHNAIYRYINTHPNAAIKILIPDQIEGQIVGHTEGEQTETREAIGAALNVAGAAVVKHSKHKSLAMKFMAFVCSEEGQQLFSVGSREYPIRNGVEAMRMLPPPDSFKVSSTPLYKLGEQRKATIKLLESLDMP